MDELYGIHPSCANYALQQVVPENMVGGTGGGGVRVDYHDVFSSFPLMGCDGQLFSGSSAESDAASMVVAGMQRNGSDSGNGNGSNCVGSEEEISSAIRAKIAAHPLYPKLVQAYIDCQKVGAPPEMAYILDEIQQESDIFQRPTAVTSCLGADPELDEFMETYCDILLKYKSDLSKPFIEATSFLNDIEAQLNTLCNTNGTLVSDEAAGGLSDEDLSGGEVDTQDSSRAHENRELKDKLLQKYSGYISTLKNEFSKKQKKGKLPKEGRQVLLNWWNVHNKWPYPTEADKIALADATGLDQKQINNWFINQRKRHWKPSEHNMQLAVVDSICGSFFMND